MSYLTKHKATTYYWSTVCMDLQLKKLSISIFNCATSKRLRPSSFHTSQRRKKSVSRTPRSSYQYHSSSMLTLRHIQPRLMNRSMGTQQFTSDMSPLVLATWLSALIHSTQNLQLSSEETMLFTLSCNDLMTNNARSATFSVSRNPWSWLLKMFNDTSKQMNASLATNLLGQNDLCETTIIFYWKYRGAAYSECNLTFKYQRFNNSKKNPSYVVPVVFPNLRGYDGHH